MADKLFKVRSKFVSKVSKEVIKQLLDDLLEDNILNDGEKDSILEENNSKADMARSLIDRVKNKGDEASNKMIVHFQERDPTLCKELGLSSCPPVQLPSGQPVQPAAEPQMEQRWSPTLSPTTDAFWREKQNDTNVYPVTRKSIKSRVALLITNIRFSDGRLNRLGAEKDEQNMENLLTALGYEVVKHTNLTGKQIKDALIQFAKHPKLKETDSVFVVIMSHGKLGAVFGVNYIEEDEDIFLIDDIYKNLETEKCPALRNKPKIIIIQACRGAKKGSVLVDDVVSDDVHQPDPSLCAAEDILDDALQCAHKEKDFIALLSSTPDTVSYRHRHDGSFLIQYVVEVLNTFASKEHVEELFRKVMQRFEEPSSHNRLQMPTKDRCTLPKHFYLYPGL